ncbi:unnamed protein product [Tuber aestivum]|uniref:Uncharacterized protein n=1 Tax=Tuber aestivum TaxID=59557 RepID=A0A292PXY4_9PEZI|nr:unnamed protein product [Tuber aestivum]
MDVMIRNLLALPDRSHPVTLRHLPPRPIPTPRTHPTPPPATLQVWPSPQTPGMFERRAKQLLPTSRPNNHLSRLALRNCPIDLICARREHGNGEPGAQVPEIKSGISGSELYRFDGGGLQSG